MENNKIAILIIEAQVRFLEHEMLDYIEDKYLYNQTLLSIESLNNAIKLLK